jgi:hypothetical protein
MDGLRALSQHPNDNVWHGLQFGAHSQEGVHGSCPLEMLHALLLGIFMYISDCFFEQLGDKSKVLAVAAPPPNPTTHVQTTRRRGSRCFISWLWMETLDEKTTSKNM